MASEEEDRAWERHMKECASCEKIGKWNKRNGTTENYHAFVYGFRIGKSLSTLPKAKELNSSSKKDCWNPVCGSELSDKDIVVECDEDCKHRKSSPS